MTIKGLKTTELFRDEIRKTRAKTKYPFGANLITMNPIRSELIQVTIDEGVGYCVLAGVLPSTLPLKI